MESIDEKGSIIVGVCIFLLLCCVTYYYLFIGQTVYYTQIDNSKIVELDSSDDMKYQYTLDCYRENGKKKTIKFKTSRELREDAYLIIEYMEVTGVHSWAEVKYEELPEKVKEKYTKHTRQVEHTRTKSDGTTETYYTTEEYWTWDYIGQEEFHTEKQ